MTTTAVLIAADTALVESHFKALVVRDMGRLQVRDAKIKSDRDSLSDGSLKALVHSMKRVTTAPSCATAEGSGVCYSEMSRSSGGSALFSSAGHASSASNNDVTNSSGGPWASSSAKKNTPTLVLMNADNLEPGVVGYLATFCASQGVKVLLVTGRVASKLPLGGKVMYQRSGWQRLRAMVCTSTAYGTTKSMTAQEEKIFYVCASLQLLFGSSRAPFSEDVLEHVRKLVHQAGGKFGSRKRRSTTDRVLQLYYDGILGGTRGSPRLAELQSRGADFQDHLLEMVFEVMVEWKIVEENPFSKSAVGSFVARVVRACVARDANGIDKLPPFADFVENAQIRVWPQDARRHIWFEYLTTMGNAGRGAGIAVQPPRVSDVPTRNLHSTSLYDTGHFAVDSGLEPRYAVGAADKGMQSSINAARVAEASRQSSEKGKDLHWEGFAAKWGGKFDWPRKVFLEILMVSKDRLKLLLCLKPKQIVSLAAKTSSTVAAVHGEASASCEAFHGGHLDTNAVDPVFNTAMKRVLQDAASCVHLMDQMPAITTAAWVAIKWLLRVTFGEEMVAARLGELTSFEMQALVESQLKLHDRAGGRCRHCSPSLRNMLLLRITSASHSWHREEHLAPPAREHTSAKPNEVVRHKTKAEKTTGQK